MKTYLKSVVLLSFLAMLSSFTSTDIPPNQKVILSKLHVNTSPGEEIKETFQLYEDGNYSYDLQKGSDRGGSITGKLSKRQFFNLKKLLHNGKIKFLNKKYECTDGTATTGNLLFYIAMPSVTKRVHISAHCPMPTALQELDDFILEITKK